jgi:hypothetical protein
MKGRGHGLLDFDVPTKALFNGHRSFEGGGPSFEPSSLNPCIHGSCVGFRSSFKHIRCYLRVRNQHPSTHMSCNQFSSYNLEIKILRVKNPRKERGGASGIATNVVLLRIRGGRSLNDPEMGITRRLSKTCFNVEYPERVGTSGLHSCTPMGKPSHGLVENIQFT